MLPLQLLRFLYKTLGSTINDLVEMVLFPLFLQHTNLVEYVCGLKIIFRFYHYPVHKNRDAISADLQIKNRPAYHGAHGGTHMKHTTRARSQTRRHADGRSTDDVRDKVTSSWRENRPESHQSILKRDYHSSPAFI